MMFDYNGDSTLNINEMIAADDKITSILHNSNVNEVGTGVAAVGVSTDDNISPWLGGG